MYYKQTIVEIAESNRTEYWLYKALTHNLMIPEKSEYTSWVIE